MSIRARAAAIDWPVALFLVAYHLALIVGLPVYFLHNTPSLALVATSLALLFVTEIGIGAAYHRYYAHRSYAMRWPAEAALLTLATLAVQGSALRWSHDHRKHHTFVDTDDDPYSIRKGFWYAHMGWLFLKQGPIEERWARDLLKNPLVVFQHRHIAVLSLGGNALLWLAVGWALGDFLGAFVLAWWARLLVSHHLTWFVNSLAHTWGERTYSKEHSAVDNYVLAFLTVGEGYHNYHHTFPADYRNGVRWYHFDPTKWTIWVLGRLGLARELKRFNRYRIRRRLLLEDRRLLLAALAERAHRKKVELEQAVEQLAARLQLKLRRTSALVEEIRRLKRRKAERTAVRAARRELRLLRQSARRDWRDWSRLCGAILEPGKA